MKMTMNQESLAYSMQVLDEIEEAVRPIGVRMQRMDLKESQGVPTGILYAKKQDGAVWDIACNVLPTHVGDVTTTYLQFYVQLTEPAPEHRAVLEEYIRRCNEQFLLGTLVLFQDCVCMKYTLATDGAVALEPEHLQTTLFAFCRQAEVFAERGVALCEGRMTLEDALRPNTN